MKTFIILLILSNLAYFAWNQGWLRDVPDPAQALTTATDDTMAGFKQAPQRLSLLLELEAPEDTVPVAEVLPEAVAETVAGTVAEIAAEIAPEAAPAPQVATPWCADIGYFEQQAGASPIVAELETIGIQAEVQSGNVPISSTYWVHMPPFASQAEALRMVAELQDNNIDSYYMRSGTLAGGVSMGVFSRRDSAEVAKANFTRRGYQTEIGEVFREDTRFWLSLRAADASILNAPSWLAFREEHNDLQVIENVCEVVASRTQFP